MSVLLATSRLNDMRPLAFHGTRAVTCYGQLRALLQQAAPELAGLGVPNAQAFLAEPEIDERSGTVDWYADGQGQSLPVASLPQADQERALAKASQIAAAIGQWAERQSQTLSQAPAQGRGQGMVSESKLEGLQMLKVALQHPSPAGDFYLVDGSLVLVNWGFLPGAQGAVPEDIARLGQGLAQEAVPGPAPQPPVQPVAPQPQPQPVPPPPPPQPQAPLAPPPPPPPPPVETVYYTEKTGCLPWLLPLLLFLLLLWLLLAALGLLPSPLPVSCLRQEGPDLRAVRMQGADLKDEEARLARELEHRALLCKPKAPEKPVEPEKPVGRSAILDRISLDTPDCTERSLKQHISNIRRKLRSISGKEYIEAIYGIGFRMKY